METTAVTTLDPPSSGFADRYADLAGAVRGTCSRCGRTPEGRATRQIVRCCMASMAAAQDR